MAISLNSSPRDKSHKSSPYSPGTGWSHPTQKRSEVIRLRRRACHAKLPKLSISRPKTHFGLQMGPIKVPRPVPGSIFHETDTRNLKKGVPGRFGTKFRDFGVGGSGAHFPRIWECMPDPFFSCCSPTTSKQTRSYLTSGLDKGSG